MPIYEYKCDGCGDVFEVMQAYSDPGPDRHACGSIALHRVMSTTAFVLKGEGWYLTDYARKGKKDSDSGSSSSTSSASTTSTTTTSTNSSASSVSTTESKKPSGAAAA